MSTFYLLKGKHISIICSSTVVSLYCIVYYPVSNGSYAPVLFVPGLFGVIYAEWYSDVFKRVASHGFIVIGVDTFWPVLSDTPTAPPRNITEEPQFIFKILQWVSQ